ncbi:MAG: beta-ketoacyl synthase N-terminal-like domain-containing protein, partial [Paracoccaceae bacterium]|nr:beta-ketoacyl synthase N-terminal-like domain-containing protein [Paracoccaceae bacterium]
MISLYYQRRSQVGFMDGFDLFDTRSLEVSTIDARPMDSRHRMVLVTTKQALEDTGIDLDQLNGSREGFEIGIASSQYLNLLKTGKYGIGHLSRAAGMAVDHLLPLRTLRARDVFGVNTPSPEDDGFAAKLRG